MRLDSVIGFLSLWDRIRRRRCANNVLQNNTQSCKYIVESNGWSKKYKKNIADGVPHAMGLVLQYNSIIAEIWTRKNTKKGEYEFWKPLWPQNPLQSIPNQVTQMIFSLVVKLTWMREQPGLAVDRWRIPFASRIPMPGRPGLGRSHSGRWRSQSCHSTRGWSQGQHRCCCGQSYSWTAGVLNTYVLPYPLFTERNVPNLRIYVLHSPIEF